MNNDNGEDNPAGEKRFKKREPYKRRHRIKTSTSAEKTEPVATPAPTTITVVDTDAEAKPQGRVEEAMEDQNEVKEEKEEKGEEAADEEKKDKVEDVAVESNEVAEDPVPEENDKGVPPPDPEKSGPIPKKGPKFKQRQSKQFKSKPPKRGVLGFGEEIPGMEGLGTDYTVICPWEAFSHLELHELAQFGII